ncbi:MAG: EF-hand domain-containing protein [Paracoccaceae bacterium]
MTRSNTLIALTLAAVAMAGLSTASLAQNAPVPGPKPVFNFDDIDVDKDGTVTKAELDAHRAAKTAEIDTNADGKLDATELAAMQVKRVTEGAEARAAKMIERLDTDGDKALSTAELAAGPKAEGLFERVDADNDGAITKVEADTAQAEMKQRRGDRKGHHGFWGWMQGSN